MNNGNFGQLVSFVFGIANDCLVDVYDVGDYRKIILPMMVIRRFDAVLEPTKQEVLKMKKQLDDAGVTEQDDALCAVAKEAFCNSSPYTLSDLRSRTNQQQLKSDFILYLDGFSKNVQDIINKFEFRNQIDKLSDHDVLGLLITKFTDQSVNLSSRPVVNAAGVTLPALDNHTMGTVFEEVIRKFNEETNVTDAGRHFTPRDIVELITDLAFIPIKDKIQSTTYSIYDGACGTGGMLTVAEQRISELADEHRKKVSINLYGQENADETYAIARSDMLVKGEGEQANHIFFGSTISNDGFSGRTFDFCLSNPPFGTPWKKDLVAWGDIKKEEITDSRFVVEYQGKTMPLVPDIGDPQMLFLANNISKMKTDTPLGTRIVEVHNGSSLFTGNAGQGASNLRQFIIEQDLLEAIVAIPEKMFYNTGIGTYLWVLTNKKEKRRKGKIQLIDATSFKSPLRKNLGEKNCEVTAEIRKQILDMYMAFDKADNRYSKVFENSEFGYWSITVERPLRLRVYPEREIPETTFKSEKDRIAVREALASLPKDTPLDDWGAFAKKTKLKAAQLKKIRPYITEKDPNAKQVVNEFDSELRDTESVPFSYQGGIDEFMQQEVLPYAPDAVVNDAKTQVGYELSFTKYFYQPIQLRTLEEITADIRAVEQKTDGLLDEILGGTL
jgi:type I restriction enzyme M protein